jgi:anti-sigma regulatory factor (Ser/Thr protein kinase)
MAQNLTLELERTPEAPGEARHALDRLNGGLDRSILPSARLLISELVTNSVKYGGDGPVKVELTVDGGRFRAEVIDQGKGFTPKKRTRDVDEVGGWGLPLVQTLADRWGTFEGSTHVWFEIEL